MGTPPGSKPVFRERVTERRVAAGHGYPVCLFTGSSTTRATASSSSGQWQEVSDGAAGMPSHWGWRAECLANPSCFKPYGMRRAQCRARAGPWSCGWWLCLTGTQPDASRWTAGLLNLVKIFQKRNDVLHPDLAVFSRWLTPGQEAEGTCSLSVGTWALRGCSITLVPGTAGAHGESLVWRLRGAAFPGLCHQEAIKNRRGSAGENVTPCLPFLLIE